MTDDPFFQRLREDARTLRHQPDEVTLARIRARIHAHLDQPTVADLLAAWFRPLIATAAALALVAAIATTVVRSNASVSIADTAVDITVGGETWRVGD
ncbi:MAG: hypothetical protein ACJ74H_09070 [Thermoanaerobaculia bacterium]